MISRLLPLQMFSDWLEQNTQFFLRLAVVTGVLLLSAALPSRVSQRNLTLLLVLLGGVGAVLLFLYRPHLGLLALIPASLIVPFEIGTGSNASLHAGVLLLSLLIGLWVLEMIAHQRKVWLASSRPILPLLIFLVIAVLAFLAGQLPWFSLAPASISAQIGGLAIFLLSGGAFLLVAHQIQDIYWLKWLTWIFLALGALYVMGRLAPGLGRFTGRLFQNGVFNHSLFWTWLVALAFSQAVFNRDLHLRWRLALGGLVVATLYIGSFQARSWASGWLPPLITLGMILWLRLPRLGLLGGVAAVVFLAFNLSTLLYIVASDAQGTLFNWDARLAAWQIVLETVKASPILGLGPSNYYHYVQSYPIMGYYVRFSSHNNYVDLIAQTGLLGLGFFLWFALAVWREGWSLRSRVEDGFSRGYVCACLGGLAGTLAAGMLGDWFLPFVYNVGIVGFRSSVLFWVFLGGLVSLKYQTTSVSDRVVEEM